MLCYDCLQEKREVPAAAVCARCGRALCQVHAVRQDRPAFRRTPAGMGYRVTPVGGAAVRFLCGECARLLESGDKED